MSSDQITTVQDGSNFLRHLALSSLITMLLNINNYQDLPARGGAWGHMR